MCRSDYIALKRDLETIREANLAEAAANPRMAALIVTHLDPPAEETEVLAIEAGHGVRLPQEYREFLLTVANGGVGPFYGLQRLGESNGKPWAESPGEVGKLSAPFPYDVAWNAEPNDPALPSEDAWQRSLWYWSTQHMDGAIPICELGCGLRQLLIVTGAERGNIWYDDRADWKGLYPEVTGDGKRIGFFEWYRSWADNKLREIDV